MQVPHKPQRSARANAQTEYDHFVALDWSMKIMAIAHLLQRDQVPRVFERPTDLKELKKKDLSTTESSRHQSDSTSPPRYNGQHDESAIECQSTDTSLSAEEICFS